MGPWPSKVIPLNAGVDLSDNPSAPTEKITQASNVDFTQKGGVRGRLGLVQRSPTDGASVINQKVTDGTGASGYAYTHTVHADPLSTWVKDMGICSPIAIRSHGQEYTGLVYSARTFIFDGVNYRDKLGGMPLRVTRQTPLAFGANPGMASAGAPALSSENSLFVASHWFGYDTQDTVDPIEPPTNATKWTIHLLDETGAGGTLQDSAYGPGPGSSAYIASSNTWGACHISINGELVLSVHTATGVVQYLLDGIAPIPPGTGSNPCICADQDTSVFYIVYVDASPLGAVKVLRVTTTGSITHTATIYSPGESPDVTGIWVSNSALATDRVVVAYTASSFGGVKTSVRHMTDLSTWSADLTLGSAYSPGVGPVVCGVVDSQGCWAAFRNSGVLSIMRRNWSSQSWIVYEVTNVIRSASDFKPGLPSWYIQHQPILFQNRVLMTVTLEPGWADLTPNNNPRLTYGQIACTWMTLDLTDMAFAPQAASGTGVMAEYSHQFPAVVARGATEETCQPWNPFTAVVTADYFEFASVDWTEFAEYKPFLQYGAVIEGFDGAVAMNRVELLAPAYAYAGDSTVIAGSVPYIVSRGNAEEVGWAENRPIMIATEDNAVSTIPAGDYSFVTVWRYTDDAGQVHRSEPSPIVTVTVTTSNIYLIRLTSTMPVMTRKDWTRIRLEVYATDVNPAANAAFYLQQTYNVGEVAPYVALEYTKMVTGSPELYTDGNVFANQFVRGDGGVVTVGQRCWVADDYKVHGSKLPAVGTAPGWYVDGALSLSVPSTAGRIVGLSSIQEKLVIFTERGIFISAGDGPDNANNGTDFVTPEQVSHLGLKEMRAAVATPQGVFFISSNMTTDAFRDPSGVGGIYLLNPGATVSWVSQRLLGDFYQDQKPVELVYCPERDWLVITLNNYSDTLAIVHDLRANQYSQWASSVFDSTLIDIRACVVAGQLVFSQQVPYFTQTTRSDRGESASVVNYGMSLTVDGIQAGDDTLTWGRFRAVKVLGYSSAGYTLSLAATIDNRSIGGDSKVITPGAAPVTWPSRYELTEWRLPTQKGSILTVQLTSSTGQAVWSSLEVAYKPANRAIAGSRS